MGDVAAGVSTTAFAACLGDLLGAGMSRRGWVIAAVAGAGLLVMALAWVFWPRGEHPGQAPRVDSASSDPLQAKKQEPPTPATSQEALTP